MTKEELEALAKRVKDAGLDTNFAARDNTRTGSNVAAGYVPSRESGKKPSGDARLDDGILGFVPYVGDALQAGQALIDLKDRKYKQAALGAGLLFLPNVIEKPIKTVVRGANKYLRRIPNGTIGLSDAINSPYKGSNIIKHDIDPTYIADVLNGEDRFITPSLGVFRIGDFNDISSRPFKYGEYSFVGDKSILDKGILFGGDSMSPTVMEVYPHFENVPSEMREEVAERLWDRTINGSHKATGTRILPSDLSTYPMNSSDGYFEYIYPGLLRMEKFKYVVAPKPGTLDEAYWRLSKDAQEDILSEFEKRGLKVKTYDRNLRPYNFYDDWSEKFLDIANEAGDDILFASGGKLVNYSGIKTLNNHMKVADQIWSLPVYVTEEYGKGGKIHIRPEIFSGKVYYRNGGILEGDFDVDDISDEELRELALLGYDVEIL